MIAKADKLLTAKQLAFCKEYVVDHNGTQAAIRAGYSEKTAQEQASRLLCNVMIKEEIGRLEGIKDDLRWNWDRNANLTYHKKQIMRYEAILNQHPDNLQALQGLNQVLRELNASSNQHSSTINTSSDVPEPISAERRVFLEKLALALTAAELTKPKLSQDLRKEA